MNKAEVKKDLKRLKVLRTRNYKIEQEVFKLMNKYNYEWYNESFDEGMFCLEDIIKEKL